MIRLFREIDSTFSWEEILWGRNPCSEQFLRAWSILTNEIAKIVRMVKLLVLRRDNPTLKIEEYRNNRLQGYTLRFEKRPKQNQLEF